MFRDMLKVTDPELKHMFKKLEKTQSIKAMIGYCLKDFGKNHFKCHVKGITEDEIKQAQAEYSYVATDPASGKTVLVKKTLFRAMYAFYMEEFHPLKKSFSEVLSK